jgi:RNA polymerase sigma-70 factor (ECF subfamily)
MPTLRAFLRRLCGSEHDADDVLQETLAKVWRLRGGFDPQQNGDAWLQQAAFRCFCDHRKRAARTPRPVADPEPSARLAGPCPTELRDELDARLAVLAPDSRALLLAFHRDGRTLQQLAAEHAVPVNTIKSWLHRARSRLAEIRP